MTLRVNRRDMLRALVAGTALTGHGVRAAQTGSVGIIGGGMAGVSLAWFLDGSRNVVLLESGDSVGGNIHSAPVELDGLQFEVDMGAQYFHPGPYPLYTALLTYLGLHSSDPGTVNHTHFRRRSLCSRGRNRRHGSSRPCSRAAHGRSLPDGTRKVSPRSALRFMRQACGKV